MKNLIQKHLAFVTAGTVTVLVLSFGSAMYLNAVDYAATARGVDVYIMTDHQTATVGQPFTADIMITNDQTPLNVMEAEVYFDPALFAVTEFTFGKSLCEERFIIDKVIDNITGRLHLSCGTITPFSGNATVFGTITATPLTPGISNVTFGELTHVYVHDGLGTEVARDTYGATILVETGA